MPERRPSTSCVQAAHIACVQRCHALIDQVRTRCVDAGVPRSGVTTEDLFLLSGSLSQAVLATADSHPGEWRRLLRISLDGLSSRNTEPLPEPDTPPTDPTMPKTRQTHHRPR